MQSRADRDQKTLVISTALVLFVLVVGAGGVTLWAADRRAGVSDELTGGLLVALVCLAGALSVGYVLREARR